MAGTLLVTGSTHRYQSALPPGNASFTLCLSSPSCFSDFIWLSQVLLHFCLLCAADAPVGVSDSLTAKTDESSEEAKKLLCSKVLTC